MSKIRSLKERVGEFGSTRRGAKMARKNRKRVAVSNSEMLELLDQQDQKLSKSIGDLTTLLTISHTMSLIDRKTGPVFSNVQNSLNSLLQAKSSLTTAKMFLSKLLSKSGQLNVEEVEEKEED